MRDYDIPTTSGKASRARAFVAVGLMLGGTALGLVGINGVLGASEDAHLEPTRGHVLGKVSVTSFRKLVGSTRGSNVRYRVHVLYSYEVGGKRYQSNRHAHDEPHEVFADQGEARARAAALMRQREITVYVDGQHPDRAALARREMAPATVATTLGGCTLAVGAFLLIGYMRRRRREQASASASNDSNDSSDSAS